ncbi:hypothetical protein DH2020_004317 [Rehmannia glutinosa]|uniref:SBP-type domain-containing protein n=1 Tax=Rehmannia glutinosa TaxID=99300 RepID=A0ABR0XPF4_REHGL
MDVSVCFSWISVVVVRLIERSRQLFPIGSNILVNNGASNNCVMLGNEGENRDTEKRRRVFDEEVNNEEGGSLNLKLGGQQVYVEELHLGKSGKKTKVGGAPSSRAVCQVEDCKADLSNAKDYHRRHKVCDVHSKATSALVGNVMQRFCQQCSRFHVLQEFDEGKRSCRRRLAGHNKRRRKTHPENVVNAATQNDERANSSDESKDQDLLSHLLSNLANLAGTTNERNRAGLLPASQDLLSVGTAALKDLTTPGGPVVTIPASSDLTQKGVLTHNASTSQSALLFPTNASSSIKEHGSDTTVGRTKLNNIDLNYVYDGSQDCMEELPNTFAPEHLGNMSSAGPLWLYKDFQKSSPPQNSGNSGSTSTQSPSTSSGEAQSRTDRIVFKLFGKDPSDFPLALRKQILDWLSNSPTDIESYIRPGCIILTIYLRMDKSSWDELYCDLTSSLRRLLNSSTDSFWRTGWIYTRVQHRVTFIYNGQVVLDTPLPVKHHRNCRISSIKPIAVTVSESVEFLIKGSNLSRSTSRLLCTLEGNYLVQENCGDMKIVEHDQIQSFSFSCVIPNIVGRGFIEVEDHGLSSSLFPFIVAEKDVCSEICSLESIIEVADGAKADTNEVQVRKNEALEFIHEMGWLLHRARLKFRLGEKSSGDVDVLFPFERFRWLTEFSIDHDWCAVVKKLLDILFDGSVDLGGQENSDLVRVVDIGLVHRAVRRNCRSMVEFLLSYHPSGALEGEQYLFRPDAMGPGGLTPLHIAAALDSCENVVDALTEDPGSVVVDILLDGSSMKQKLGNAASKFAALESEKKKIGGRECGQCKVMLNYGRCSRKASVRIYRPAMLSMVAIAAVCVCTALLFKSSPEVLYSLQPFRWELLKYGSQ